MTTSIEIFQNHRTDLKARFEAAYAYALTLSDTTFVDSVIDEYLEDFYKLEIAITGIGGGGGGGSGGITQLEVKNAIKDAADEAKMLVTDFGEEILTSANTATTHRDYTGYHYGAASVKVTGIGSSLSFRIEACNGDPTVEANWFNVEPSGEDVTIFSNETNSFNWEGLPFRYFRVKLVSFTGGSPSVAVIVRYGV